MDFGARFGFSMLFVGVCFLCSGVDVLFVAFFFFLRFLASCGRIAHRPVYGPALEIFGTRRIVVVSAFRRLPHPASTFWRSSKFNGLPFMVLP